MVVGWWGGGDAWVVFGVVEDGAETVIWLTEHFLKIKPILILNHYAYILHNINT